MSANIPIGKLKFSVFGRGYDDVRGNSGTGTVDEEIDMRVSNAVIDATGAYVWANILWEDEYHTVHNKFVKLSTSDWQEVEQTTIPDDCNVVFHPCNISNNYGLALQSIDASTATAYVFDLTDDTLIATITAKPTSGETKDWESILVDDKIYVINRHAGRATNNLWTFDIVNETFDESVTIAGVGCNGFINDSLIYACYIREWFYQTSTAYAYNLSGTAIWSNGGIDRNDNMSQWGFTGNGKIYLPVKTDDKWHIGEFDGTSNPTFNPVSPIRTFGTFDSCPNFLPFVGYNDTNLYFIYNDGKTKACACTSNGVMLTDFTNVDFITDQILKPIAMNDDMVLCVDYNNNKLYVIGL